MRRLLSFLSILAALAGAAFAADPISFTVGAFTFERPESWAWIPPTSPMRKAQLGVPAADGGAAGEVTFFHFGAGQGGGVQANVDRWLAQFQNPVSSTRSEKVGPTTITWVEAVGTFASGMPGGPTTPKEGFALRGAILESPQGDVYVKLTGPEPLVKSATTAFEKMVRSAAGS